MAINDALIGDLRLDRGWIGQLNANLLDVKGNFSVTDGNGKRTLDIDSFGNVNLSPSRVEIDIAQNGVYLTHNGYKRLGLRRGMLQLYNYNNNEFLGGISPQISQDNTVKGMALNATPNSQFFAFNYIPSWTSEDNADPTGLSSYMILNYKDRGTETHLLQGLHLFVPLFLGGNVYGKNNNIYDINEIHANKLKGDIRSSLWQSNTGIGIATFEDPYLKMDTNLNLRGKYGINGVNSFTTSKILCNSYRGSNDVEIFYTYGTSMYNVRSWDWGGHNLSNAKIIGSSVTYGIASGYSVDVENDTEVLIANEDISDIDENGNVSYDLNEMIKLLYNKIHSLEKEIETLKRGV